MGIRFLLLCLLAVADCPAEMRWAVQEENDKFTSNNSDRYYTQGLRISWMNKALWHGSITQEINTPSDGGVPSGPFEGKDDLPYSGALFASLGRGYLFPERQAMASVEVKVGVIGPSALGRQAQNSFHRVIGSSALDWDRQMPDEPVVNFDAEVRRRIDLDGPEHSHWDLLVRARGSLGNLRSGLSLGAQLRFGVLDQGWGHGFIRQSNAWVDPVTANEAGYQGWHFFTDASLEVMPHDYTTSGPTFSDFEFEAPVETRPIVAQFAVGILTRLNHASFSFSVAHRTKEFSGQQGSGHAYGSFRFTFNL